MLKTIFYTLLFSLPSIAMAGDVYISGYHRSDGTYVRPHVRSAPDSYKWNNYGPSTNSNQLLNPRSRDSDSDGVPNYLDNDDNNNGIFDDFDLNQYRQ